MAIELPPIIITPKPQQPPVGGFPTIPVRPPNVAQPPQIYDVMDNFGDLNIPNFSQQWNMSFAFTLTGIVMQLDDSVRKQIVQVPTTMDKHVRDLRLGDEANDASASYLQRDAEVVKAVLVSLNAERDKQRSLVRGEFRVSNLSDKGNGVQATNYIYRNSRQYRNPNEAFQIWSASYRAQHMESLINHQISYLEGKLGNIESELTRIKSDPTYVESLVAANTYSVPASMANAAPFVALPGGIAAIASAAELTLRDAITAAVARLAAAGAVAASSTVAIFAVLMGYSSRLGDSTRQAMSIPLADLYLASGGLQELALQGGEIDLPVRLAFEDFGDHQQIFIAPTGGAIPSGVKIRAARFEAASGGYKFQTDDNPPRTLVWTPVVDPSNSSTELPPMDTDIPDYSGPVIKPIDPVIEVLPTVGDVPFDDYVLVFPADSGLEPIYVMFRDRRSEPGVANGAGEAVSGAWLTNAGSDLGAAIPSQLAQKLRGREFASFDRMRQAVWMEVALDVNLAPQFSTQQKKLMMQGLSPFAPKAEQVGGRKKYELHHVDPIGGGGAVYNVDNIRVLTPKRHIEIHSNKGGD